MEFYSGLFLLFFFSLLLFFLSSRLGTSTKLQIQAGRKFLLPVTSAGEGACSQHSRDVDVAVIPKAGRSH